MEQSLWYATHATGLVTWVLLTATLILGLTIGGRASTPGWPRFALAALHRNLALLSVLFLAVHVSSSLIGADAEVRWMDVLVPFLAGHHPLWMGLGAVAFDLLLASAAVGALRDRLSVRLWRGVHWAAYLSWPAALAHGVGVGETGLNWVTGIKASGTVAVVAALLWRRQLTRRAAALRPRRIARHGR